jgi:drug/metabolite transporter (DMT)-like permease
VLSILLAALSAAVWGAADFSGGKAAQTSRTLSVTVLSQIAGLPVLAVSVALFSSGAPTVRALGAGAVAGISGFAGLLLLYRGLSQGAMAIFAPISAVTSAVVPLGVGLVVDRTPSWLALVGVAFAVVAIGLVSVSGGATRVATPRVITLALASGTCFGLFFVLVSTAGPGAGQWPLVGARVGSISVGLLAVVAVRGSLSLDPVGLRWTLVVGPLDILANVLYLAAAAHGQLAVVAPISALYPVSTVLLAMIVDRERLVPVQVVGLGLAATALVLVAT